jgi:zinc protease
MKSEGPTADEVQKVKEQERRGRETNLQENNYWASQLVYADQSGSDPRFLVDFGLIEGVTGEELTRGARRWLNTDRYVQVVLLPEEGAASTDQGDGSDEGGR